MSPKLVFSPMCAPRDAAYRVCKTSMPNKFTHESERSEAEARTDLRRALAHDLKTPLAGLRWHVQLLSMNAKSGRLSPTDLDEGLAAIAAAAAEASHAINALHELTRSEAAHPLAMRREPLDVLALVSEVATTSALEAHHRVRIEATLPGPVVFGDRSRLSRVFGNLFDNAAKYSAHNSEVVISVDREREGRAERAVVRVADSGVGIPKLDLPHIFERYYRGSNIGRISGDGLGLARVQAMVERHAGSVVVNSREGRGTTFTVRLPAARD